MACMSNFGRSPYHHGVKMGLPLVFRVGGCGCQTLIEKKMIVSN